jgi:hypothetical protein
VAVAAIQAEPSDVVLVAEGDGLLALLGNARDPGGAVNLKADPAKEGHDEDRAEHREPRYGVGAVME